MTGGAVTFASNDLGVRFRLDAGSALHHPFIFAGHKVPEPSGAVPAGGTQLGKETAMRTIRTHAKKIVAVMAVVVGLGAGGAVLGSHVSNTRADQFNATHPVAGLSAVVKTAPVAKQGQAASTQSAAGSGQVALKAGDGGRGD